MTANFSDTRSITAYSHWLVMKAQTAGNLRFDGHTATMEEKLVAEQCRTLCDKISHRLAVSKGNDIPCLLECYDIAYRVGNRRMPDNAFIDRYKRRVLKAWKSGDRSIEESSVFSIVAHEAKYRPNEAEKEYIGIYQTIKRKWIDTLVKHDRFQMVTAYENYQRLALIMLENIDNLKSATALIR